MTIGLATQGVIDIVEVYYEFITEITGIAIDTIVIEGTAEC